MIEYHSGDLFLSSDDALVNPINCAGVMGAGLAKKFKDKYPEMFVKYQAQCFAKRVTIGKMYVYTIPKNTNFNNNKYIINFPTKLHWKDPSKPEYVTDGLKSLLVTSKELNIKSISLPALGCGLGNLSWKWVKEQIENTLIDEKITFNVYYPK